MKVYQAKLESDVRPAFQKYDKDGNGTIDRDELAALSLDLGSPLTEEELDIAYHSLDINKDGVIDFDEFSRWYFSGMKSYSGRKRSMLKFQNGVASFSEALKDPELVKEILSDTSLVK